MVDIMYISYIVQMHDSSLTVSYMHAIYATNSLLFQLNRCIFLD